MPDIQIARFPVEESHVLFFSRAIGDAASRDVGLERVEAEDLRGSICPPTFVVAGAQFDPDYPLRPREGEAWFGSGASPTGADETPLDDSGEKRANGASLHAEQSYHYHRPVRVGDVLSAQTRPGRTWSKEGRRGGKLIFVELVTDYRDQRGELVVSATRVGVRTERLSGGSEGGR
jgi:hypothetical protein